MHGLCHLLLFLHYKINNKVSVYSFVDLVLLAIRALPTIRETADITEMFLFFGASCEFLGLLRCWQLAIIWLTISLPWPFATWSLITPFTIMDSDDDHIRFGNRFSCLYGPSLASTFVNFPRFLHQLPRLIANYIIQFIAGSSLIQRCHRVEISYNIYHKE